MIFRGCEVPVMFGEMMRRDDRVGEREGGDR